MPGPAEPHHDTSVPRPEEGALSSVEAGVERAFRVPARVRDEAPTIALLFAVHGAFFALVLNAAALGFVTYVLLAVVIALHSSLQHEVLHGHPFRGARLNALTVALPLGLAVPYWRFRALHTAHHVDPRLTDPYEDPESWYLDPQDGARLSRPLRLVLEANNTLAGRLLLGPAVGLVGFWRADVRLMRAGREDVLRAWGEHLVCAGVLVAFLSAASEVSGWGYFAACYGGASLLSLRTFLEHQAAPETGHRTVLIEDRGPFAWLFLFNSLHAVHHERPKLAWHRIPAAYRAERARYLAQNGGYVYRSYLDVARRYFFTRKEPLIHPLRGAGPAKAAGRASSDARNALPKAAHMNEL